MTVPTNANVSPKAQLRRLRHSGPPNSASPSPARPSSESDSVSLRSAAQPPENGTSSWGRALLVGVAALGAASSLSPDAAAEVTEAVEAPFEMLRMQDGEVAFHTGVGDRLVYPDLVAHREVPGATEAAESQRGESVCSQALDLGGRCDGENIGYVDTPHGTLIVEQNDRTSLDIYSMEGGHVRMGETSQGTEVNTHQGTAVFHQDGSILLK